MITIPFNLTVQRRQWTIPRRDVVMSAGDTLRFAVTVYDSELSVSAKVLTGFTADLHIYSTRPQRDGYGYEYDIESGSPLVSAEGALQDTQGVVWFTLSADDTRMISTGRYTLSFVLQSENGYMAVSRGIVNIGYGAALLGPIPLIGFQDAYVSLEAGAEEVEFTVERTRIAPGVSIVSTVVWTTSAGTTGTISFGPGDLDPKTVMLSVADETEDWRVFTITLSDITNAEYAIRVMTVEVQPLLLTSRPYPVEVTESMDAIQAIVTGGTVFYPTIDDMDVSQAVITGGTLRAALQTYLDWPAESIDATQALVTGGTLRTQLQTYTLWPVEAIDATQAVVTAGTLKIELISYLNWPVEAIDATQVVVTGGTLS